MKSYFMMKNAITIILLGILFASCTSSDTETPAEVRDYKQDMRNFVIGISQYAKAIDPSFAIIPQNGIELVTTNGLESGSPATAYLDAIDGNGQEDLNFGYDNDDIATPGAVTSYLKTFLDISNNQGNIILATDYCSTHDKMDMSYDINNAFGYISFAASERALNVIPNHPTPIYNENTNNINTLQQAKNFIFLVNPENYVTKTAFINAAKSTNYDALIIDLFFNGEALTASDIDSLKTKANGGARLVICYMSIGEAEDYRYYWNPAWSSNKPEWLKAENPDWPGNYKVQYWNSDWQHIIYGNNDSYLKKITDAHFDGVYLDIIDAFEYFE
ncbi:endo alpha-1,4 polygalactosaminidase [Flavobacterium sp. 3HN19-14]|uniref:endo alpha-1,4 polygalactosaminidase n=1 Tax=Flavobacterium sp. 3HN19-14 TaxID=3448133 RepID=UPI003EE00D70